MSSINIEWLLIIMGFVIFSVGYISGFKAAKGE